MLDIGNASEQLAANLAATIQATGAQWTEPTIAIVLQDLTRYPEEQVIYALARCRVELKFRLTVGDIIERFHNLANCWSRNVAHTTQGACGLPKTSAIRRLVIPSCARLPLIVKTG